MWKEKAWHVVSRIGTISRQFGLGRLARDFASDRREWRADRSFLQDEIKVLRKRLDLDAIDAERGPITELRRETHEQIERLRQLWQGEKQQRSARDEIVRKSSERIAQLQRENAAARAASEHQRFEQALAERDRRIDALETRLAMLLGFIGGDLPRGYPG